MIRIGELRHRIELRKPAPGAANEFNELKPAEYQSAGSVWAQVEELSGNELEKSQQIQSEITMRVTIRYRADITSRWQIIYRGRTLDLASPPLDLEGRRRELQLLCKEAKEPAINA